MNLSCVRLLRVGGTRGNERVLVEATMPSFLPSPPPPGGSDSQGNIKRASPAHKWVRFWLWPVLVWQKAVGRKKGWTKVEALSGLKGPTLWGHHFLLLIAPQATQRASSRLFEEKERGRIRFLNKTTIYYQTTLNSVNKFKLSWFAIQGKESNRGHPKIWHFFHPFLIVYPGVSNANIKKTRLKILY